MINRIVDIFKKSKKKDYDGKYSCFTAYDRKISISKIFGLEINKYSHKFIIPIGNISKSDAEKAIKDLISRYK